MRRSTQFSGSFYPDQPAILADHLQRLCPVQAVTRQALAVMAPHAGYLYSGRFAGKVFSAINIPDRVILLGPNHTGLGQQAAVYADGSWETPLGPVPVDDELARELLATSSLLSADVLAHSREHSLEVMLPLLQYRNPNLRIVPICIGRQALNPLLEIGAAIAEVVATCPEQVLLVASSDMTHFTSAAQAARQDRLALEQIARVDAAGLYHTVITHQISMCGVLPMTATLAAVHALGARKAEIVAYGHSGEVTGDDSDVVAYAGAIVPLPDA